MDTLDRRPRQIDFIREILGRCSECQARVGEHDRLLCSTCVSALHAELRSAQQAIDDDVCPNWDEHDRIRHLRSRMHRLYNDFERVIDNLNLPHRDDQRLRDLLYEMDSYL